MLWKVYVTLTGALYEGCLECACVYPTTVKLGINPGFAQLGLGIMARCGRPQLPTEADSEMAGILFAIPLCTLADSVEMEGLFSKYLFCILCVLPDSWNHYFLF